jgi:GNAT superfamily N-acetyltransferase
MHFDILSKNGVEFVFRKLETSDEKVLGDFFLKLSNDTKSKFGPHPLTFSCAKELCCSINHDKVHRFIVINKTEIAGYFILDFTLFSNEAERYQQVGLKLDSSLDPVFAPCIADKYQNSGIASRSMSLIINIAREENLRRIVLMGGTQIPNTLARSFYKKFNFKEFVNFYTAHNQLDNIDMMLELNL